MTDSTVFTAVPLDKWQWSPSPLPGQVVLVTSRAADGTPDVAPKSWVTIVGMTGPRIGFGCSWQHRTARNVRETGEFVINLPDQGLAEAAWRLPELADRWALPEMATVPAVTVGVPALARCYVHIECRLDRIVEFEAEEVFIVGLIQRLEIDQAMLAPVDIPERYQVRQPFFFLEEGWAAPLGPARRVS